jgi:hypothetical protein
MLDGTVVGLLGLGAEITGRQFPVAPMVSDAIAAFPMLLTGIGTVTILRVGRLGAFHRQSSFLKKAGLLKSPAFHIN